MSNIYSAYINPLDALVFDSIIESKPSDMETEANLALWVILWLYYHVHLNINNCKYTDKCTIYI